MSDTFKAGSWNCICDRCGFEFKADQLRLEWTNLRTCHGNGTNGCWQPRNTQEKVKGVPDRQAPPWVRPGGDDIELTVNQVQAGDL